MTANQVAKIWGSLQKTYPPKTTVEQWQLNCGYHFALRLNAPKTHMAWCKYRGHCFICGQSIAKGAPSWYDPETRNRCHFDVDICYRNVAQKAKEENADPQ